MSADSYQPIVESGNVSFFWQENEHSEVSKALSERWGKDDSPQTR